MRKPRRSTWAVQRQISVLVAGRLGGRPSLIPTVFSVHASIAEFSAKSCLRHVSCREDFDAIPARGMLFSGSRTIRSRFVSRLFRSHLRRLFHYVHDRSAVRLLRQSSPRRFKWHSTPHCRFSIRLTNERFPTSFLCFRSQQ
jgi:hypothetical protein